MPSRTGLAACGIRAGIAEQGAVFTTYGGDVKVLPPGTVGKDTVPCNLLVPRPTGTLSAIEHPILGRIAAETVI